MKNFALALSIIIQQEKAHKVCSQIDAFVTKKLFRKSVKIREIESGISFDATVIDYSIEGDPGIIVSLSKKDSEKLINKKSCCIAELNPETTVELDLRKSFDGDKFEIISLN